MDILLKNHKEIFDSIHGYIKLSKMACLIIDTVQFQRLRYLHQLGTCQYVYPSASHTRFEHSIGTYYLAGKTLDILKLNSNTNHINECMKNIPYLQSYYLSNPSDNLLDNYVCELIKIAALCHDIGHGPFSHVFDDVFMHNFKNNNNPLQYHENRSCALINYIIHHNTVLETIITQDHIDFICNLINPTKESYGFIYQIVSNNFNSLDVDKFDYICRDTHTLGLKYSIDIPRLIDDMVVIDNKICFLEKLHYELVSLFKTRYRLHKQVYCHKAVIAIQFMITDIMLLINEFIKLYQSISNMDDFVDLTEDYIFTYLKLLYKNKENYEDTQKNKIIKAYEIYQRIITRNLYKLIGGIVSENEIDINVIKNNIDSTKLLCYKSKIGFVSGSKNNPLDEIYFYKKNNIDKCFKITNENISLLVPKIYQEYIYMFFIKDKNDNDTINQFKELYKKIEF